MVKAGNHPLAGRSGVILLHRKLLYDRIGPGWHPCHWCGELVEWRVGGPGGNALLVDHVDHDKLNNAPENLVPSCNPCNGHRLRGEAWEPWVPGTPVGRPERLHARCRKGHLLTPDNVYIRPDTGARTCLTCIEGRSQEKYAAATPEQREADLARNRESIPCPVCGERKNRASMRRHIRAMHEGPTSADLQRSQREEALQRVLDAIRAIRADGGKITQRRLHAEVPGFPGAQRTYGYRTLVEMACGDASFLLLNSGPKGAPIRGGSPGASHCAGLARAAGIPVEFYRA